MQYVNIQYTVYGVYYIHKEQKDIRPHHMGGSQGGKVMRKLNEEEKKELKNAVAQMNDWKGFANIMYDESDNSIWCDVFASCNEWNEYHSDSIYTVVEKSNFEKFTQKGVANIIEKELYKDLDSRWYMEARGDALYRR